MRELSYAKGGWWGAETSRMARRVKAFFAGKGDFSEESGKGREPEMDGGLSMDAFQHFSIFVFSVYLPV